MGTPLAVKVGPGLLYVAPVGTTDPTPVTGTPSAPWVAIGFTDAGHSFTPNRTSEPIEVAESLTPIKYVNTREEVMIEFEMAEINAQNLAIAFNGGTIGSPSGGLVKYTPPALGAEERLKILWQSDDHQEVLVIEKALQSGAVGMPRRKAPDKTVIPVQFRVEVPDSGDPWGLYEPATLAATDPH